MAQLNKIFLQTFFFHKHFPFLGSPNRYTLFNHLGTKLKKLNQFIAILALVLTSAFCSTLLAQQTISGATISGAILPKKGCMVAYTAEEISITGNLTKTIILAKKGNGYSDFVIKFLKLDGRARTTFTVFVNGVKKGEREFEDGKGDEQAFFSLYNIAGGEIMLKVKNHSATHKIIAKVSVTVKTNSMLVDDLTYTETITKLITQPSGTAMAMHKPCSNKAIMQIKRLDGTSNALIKVIHHFYPANNVNPSVQVLKEVTMESNETSKIISLTNISNHADSGPLELRILNLQTNKFIKVKIEAWFN